MWIAITFVQFLVALVTGGPAHHHDEIVCFGVNCHHDQVCKITNVNGQLNGKCIYPHEHEIPVFGCPATLTNNQVCYCATSSCAHTVHSGSGAVVQPHGCSDNNQNCHNWTMSGECTKNPGYMLVNCKHSCGTCSAHVLTCGGHDCHHHQVCQHYIYRDGTLHSRCYHEEDMLHHDPHPDFGCTTMPVEHNPCYCRTEQCNTNLLHIQQTHNSQALVASYNHTDHASYPEMVCIGVHCKHDEVCKITNVDGHVNGECIKPHGHEIPTFGCPATLSNNHVCYCATSACAHAVHAGSGAVVQPLAHSLTCGGHDCHHDQVCEYKTNIGGILHSACKKEGEILKHDPHPDFGCTTMPHVHDPCYCRTERCNTNLLHMFYQQTHNPQVAANHQFRCGEHMCHGTQKCLIEDHYLNGTLKLHCRDHMPHHITEHCLPTIRNCFCETKNCVDQTLISHIAGHQVSGLICSEKNDTVCAPNERCIIRHDAHAHFTFHCGAALHTYECTRLPVLGDHCFCTTQSCVYGYFTDHTTTTVPIVSTTQVITNSTTTPGMINTQTTQTATNASTTPAVTNATITPVVTNTFAAASSSVTNPITTTTSPSTTTVACKDNEDSLFSCVSYDIMYGLCSATTGTLYDIALKRCRSFCGYCNGTSSGSTSSTPSTLQHVCVDHDIRCQQHARSICSATVSKEYVISTCAKTCNKCSEYFALLEKLMPTTVTTTISTTTSIPTIAPVPQCHTCGDYNSMLPCNSNEVFGNGTMIFCPPGKEYCMTDVFSDMQGNKDVFKRCVSEQTCQTKWLTLSSGKDYCTQFDPNNKISLECHFCCHGDFCNTDIKPPNATLVKQPLGR